MTQHNQQLTVCQREIANMQHRVDEVLTEVKSARTDIQGLREDRVAQNAINDKILDALDDLYKRDEKQEVTLSNLYLFAWVGRNWIALSTLVIATAGGLIAYINL